MSPPPHLFYPHPLLSSPQARVVPPWVEEHPDVFNDPEFSITQLDSTVSGLSDTTASAMDVSVNPQQLAWVRQKDFQQWVMTEFFEITFSLWIPIFPLPHGPRT